MFCILIYILESISVSSVQSFSRVRLFATPWIAACQASLSITSSWGSLKLTSFESVMPSSHLILCRPLFLLPPIPLSIRVFYNESTLRMRWPKYCSFSFNISPSNEHPGVISFRMDWLDLLAVQGILKSLLQHHSSKASILQRSAFFTIQLSHPYTLSTFYSWEHSMMSPNIKLTPSLFGKLTLTHFVRLHLRPHFLWEVFPGLLSFVGCSLTLSFVPNITLISVNVGSNWFVTGDLSCSHTD